MIKRVFSGIKPTGDLHLGNYLGAIKQWVQKQDQRENFFCIVDLHAITVPQDPKILTQKTRQLAALYLACGLDPNQSVIFIQSHNQDHAQLAWILNCFLSMGQLSRMTQFKDKAEKQDFVSVGLFDYPALMAADILLYDADEVPVGDDQKQHVELTRDVADRFNSRYQKEIFKLPEPVIMVGRIKSLQDPGKKMSKSEADYWGTIDLLDQPEVIVKKVKRAVTDSGSEIKSGEDKPALSNLLQIYSELAGKSVEDLEKDYQGQGYADFKKDLAEVIVNALKPIQSKYQNAVGDQKLDQVLAQGLEKAQEFSNQKLAQVQKVVGLG